MKNSLRRSLSIGVIVVVIAFFVALALWRPSAESESIPLGSVLILSGEFKSYGEYFQQGALLATERLRASGGTPVNLTILDSEGNKEKALEQLKALREQYGVRFVADVMGTPMLKHALPFLNENKMLIVSGVNTGPDLSVDGGRMFFRIIPSDGVASQQLARWALAEGWKRAAILSATDDWGAGLKGALERAYQLAGGEIIDSRNVELTQTIFQPVVARYRESKPDVVFLLLYPKTAALFLREARKQGLNAKYMGTDNFTASELPDLAREAVNGVLFVVPGAGSEGTPENEQFIKAYQAKYGSNVAPHLFARMAFDVVGLLAQAHEASGGDPEKAAAYLESVSYRGATGEIKFDTNHDVVVRDYTRKTYQYDPSTRKATIVGVTN
jgi:branched-chain amino acid transport system substrate-binding protein